MLEDRSRRKARRPERRLRFLQPAELDALLRAVLDDELGAVERPLYLTAAITGLGQGEPIALPRSDVDWLARRIRVADNFPRGRVDERDSPKSHEARSGPIAYRVVAELERHFQRTRYCADHGPLLLPPRDWETAGPLEDGKRFKKALKRAVSLVEPRIRLREPEALGVAVGAKSPSQDLASSRSVVGESVARIGGR